jgi:hypothetical protein
MAFFEDWQIHGIPDLKHCTWAEIDDGSDSKDSLVKYFGDQIDNPTLFRPYGLMETFVGEFKDVPLEK